MLWAILTICAGNDALANLIKTRLTSDTVLDPTCTEMMQGWLERCRTDHALCPKYDTEHELPTRVIDVGDAGDVPVLVVSNGRWGTWVALSHCWGRRLEVKTTRTNLQAHCEGRGLALIDLPRTFEDAIRITRELGIRYLWIDALCIVQDDQEDWAREAVRMRDVYGNAAVTIAAEACTDNTIGILKSMKEWRFPSDKLLHTACHSDERNIRGRLYFRTNHRKYNNWKSRGNLSTRAWTMQEELLSPHVLRFGSQQVIWNCSMATYSEWAPEHNDQNLWDFASKTYRSLQDIPVASSDFEVIPSGKDRQQLLEFWYMEVVNYYIGRGLTYKTDRLIAIDGIAEEVRNRMVAFDYAAGIWYQDGYQHSADIHKGLAWSVPVGGAKTNEEQYIAPSWSWAQINVFSNPEFGQHNFVYQSKLLKLFTPLTEEINISTYTIQPSSTSSIPINEPIERLLLKVKSQYLDVCSCLVPGWFLDARYSDPEGDYHWKFDRISERHNAQLNLIGLKAIKDRACESIGRDKSHRRLVYVQLGRWSPDDSDDRRIPVIIALILEEAGTALEILYRRVGLAVITVDPRKETEPWPIQCFPII